MMFFILWFSLTFIFSNETDADNLFGDSSDESEESDESEDEKPSSGLSKKERVEALIRARKARETSSAAGAKKSAASSKSKEKKKASASDQDQKGYESDGSIHSADFVRTKEDDDFIDIDDDDPDARRELYAEQHFDDEEAEEDEAYVGRKGKKKRKIRFDEDADMRRSKKGDEDPDNPIMEAVNRMKKKKKEVKKISDLEEEAKGFIYKMMVAAKDDEEDIKAKRPALRKLAMLNSVMDMAARREMMRPLLDNELLTACGQWIQPLPNGSLGNVTLRSDLLRSIAHMNGENGISTDDLRRSGFGKKVMALYMHKDETPEMKRFLKQLIEQWSRPVFQKSGNMKDLERVQRERRDTGIAAISRAKASFTTTTPSRSPRESSTEHDFSTIIAKGHVKGSRDLGGNRVRVPYSKGFQFTVRPESKAPTVENKKAKAAETVTDQRESLNKRMIEKGRVKSKNYRSTNISIEGRAPK